MTARPASLSHLSETASPRAVGLPDLAVLIVLLGMHASLALMMRDHPALAKAHALVTLAVGLWGALRWPLARVACVAGYIMGAEVLWRMSAAPIPWEFAKYAIVLVFALALLRNAASMRSGPLPLLYFILLTPSLFLLAADHAIATSIAIQMASFNLSGPLALCVSVWFFSQVSLDGGELRRVIIALLCPIAGIAAIALVSTYSASDLTFTDESNLVTSGGFGPNQVSAVFGLGVLGSLLLAVDEKVRASIRVLMFALALLLGAQSAMTFSRGGLYTVGGAIAMSAVFLLRDARTRRTVLVGTPLVAVIVAAVLIPRMESITAGALGDRFGDFNPTHRQDIAREDFRIWRENPMLGVGPGMAKRLRQTQFRVTHTEYTRMLSEHGILGVLAMLCLFAMAVLNYHAQDYVRGRGLAIAFSMWSLLAMLHIGMRIAAVSVIFGLAAARFVERGDRGPVTSCER
ncbi:MAG: hypothetical protein HOQ11_01080 [Gemmatimonadaceae bacterium]|nr:hypothetical protein [Gemmatimonadaceae bacterium]NUQ91454.1 hypothetical protein [Gemmatimonadaceae bacterium]NUR20292.1 hypothetical protein [Gemmatimonadaceae bacterium]NUS95981.1 hypothetical protein [Gemmatimonadaceae bacterium]